MKMSKRTPSGFALVHISTFGTMLPIPNVHTVQLGITKYKGQALGNVLLPLKGEKLSDYEKRLLILNQGRSQKMISIYSVEGKKQYIIVQKIAAHLNHTTYQETKDPILKILKENIS